MGLLNVLRRRLSAEGRVLLETYGAADRDARRLGGDPRLWRARVYARDDYVYCGASPPRACVAWPRHAGFERFDAPVIDAHPRVIGTLRDRPSRRIRAPHPADGVGTEPEHPGQQLRELGGWEQLSAYRDCDRQSASDARGSDHGHRPMVARKVRKTPGRPARLDVGVAWVGR
jgi:hypothetical protein